MTVDSALRLCKALYRARKHDDQLLELACMLRKKARFLHACGGNRTSAVYEKVANEICQIVYGDIS